MNTLHLQMAQACRDNLDILEKMSPIERLRSRVAELDGSLNGPGLWSNPKSAAALMKDRKKLSDALEFRVRAADDVELYLDIIQSGGEIGDKDFAQLFELNAKLGAAVFESMMTGPTDINSAILSINSGAGGLEANDFSSMLLRMYTRYCNANGFEVEIVDMKETDGGYIDSVTITVTGDWAYGYLKNEVGTHRLVRNSPFNSGNARHTSFSAVNVLPDVDDSIEIDIKDEDLEIVAMRRGGKGGQNQNKVSSSVRLSHIPSGISFVVCTERDFHKNKKTALKMLNAKLYDLEMQKKNTAQDAAYDAQKDIAFGSQIRSYVLSPYTSIKDHRTKYESRDAQAVLDGDIQGFLEASLRKFA